MSRAELEQELTARGVHDFVGEKDELQVCQSMFTQWAPWCYGYKVQQLCTSPVISSALAGQGVLKAVIEQCES